ncbi:hypothetical protein DM01DRAFT_61337 [Hesseltinella vesiculosa]|uniref:BLOC-1-related complex subunit 5 n=1 Tax=Hesseltinella vesiculosa TaxID=101127 RepID=A0A1X2GBY8_9FUNG|nr:hypothetical protein DM01DRAFT_61337 [Hesseltinella vesiculosa]
MDILLSIQQHMYFHMHKINDWQRRLAQRIKYVDHLSLNTTQTIAVALNQAKLASEQLEQAKAIKEQAKQSRQYTTSIFETMRQLEEHLDAEDRADHPHFQKRWPALHQLHQRALLRQRPKLLKQGSQLDKTSTTSTVSASSLQPSTSTPPPSQTLLSMQKLRSLIGQDQSSSPHAPEKSSSARLFHYHG